MSKPGWKSAPPVKRLPSLHAALRDVESARHRPKQITQDTEREIGCQHVAEERRCCAEAATHCARLDAFRELVHRAARLGIDRGLNAERIDSRLQRGDLSGELTGCLAIARILDLQGDVLTFEIGDGACRRPARSETY
jgi:hypothetical protein